MVLKKISDGKGRRVEVDLQRGIVYKTGPLLKMFLEWRKLKSAYAAGLEVPQPIGFRIQGIKGQIIMTYIRGRPLAEVLLEIPESQKVCLAYQLGKILSVMHNYGFVHNDLHPSNLLVTEDQKIVVLDVYKLQRVCRSKSKLRNLAILYGAFIKDLDFKVILAFLKGYLGDFQKAKIFCETFGWHISVEGRRNILNIIKREVSHIENPRRFKLLVCGKFTGYLSLRTGAIEYEKTILSWLKTYQEKKVFPGKILKNSRSTLVVVYEGLCFKFFKKRSYKWLGFKDKVAFYFGRSRGKISFERAYIYFFLGGATPKPLAYFESPQGESLFVSMYLRDYLKLSDLLRSLPEQRRNQCLKKLFYWVKQFLESGFVHRDFKLNNILVSPTKLDFFLVDTLDLYPSNSLKERRKTLRRLIEDLCDLGFWSDQIAKYVNKIVLLL